MPAEHSPYIKKYPEGKSGHLWSLHTEEEGKEESYWKPERRKKKKKKTTAIKSQGLAHEYLNNQYTNTSIIQLKA